MRLLPVCLLLTLLLGASSQIPTEVVLLNNDNFEDKTQAGTGQTTGIWFVLFNSHLHHNYQKMKDLWAQLAADEEKEIILGEVNLDDPKNLYLSRRFTDLQPPAAALFRDRRMWLYPASLSAEDAEQSLVHFMREGWEHVKPKRVPGEMLPASLEDLSKVTKTNWSHAGWGFVLFVIGFAIKMWAQNKAEAEGEAAAAAAAEGQGPQEASGNLKSD